MESDESLEIPYGGTRFMPGFSVGRLLDKDGCEAFAYRLTKEGGPTELEQTAALAMEINDMMKKQGGEVLTYHYDKDAENGDKCVLLLTSELPPDIAQFISGLGFNPELIKQGCARMKTSSDGTIGGYIKLC